MRLIRNPELRGIIVLFLIILALAVVLAAASGKLEQWFNISLFSGPRALDRIVFVSIRSGAADLYSMATDGSDQTRLTTGVRVLSAPAISPAGNRIVFVGLSGGAGQVFSVGGRGGEPELLTTTSVSKSKPGFSPDGKRLSFLAAGKLYIGAPDGSDPDAVLPTREETHRALTQREPLPTYRDYAWSSDGQGIVAVARDKDGNDSVRYLPFSGESRVLLGVARDPSGADVLVFVPDPANPEPKPLARVEKEARVEGLAAASGKPLFAFTMHVDGKQMLWLFDAQRGRLDPVIALEKQELGVPALSPDGASLVVPVRSRDQGIASGLVTMDLDSGRGSLITPGSFESAAFSPAGDRVLAVRVEGEGASRDIVAIDPDSGEVTQLTSDGRSFDPIWTPVSER